jgi:hypothetical protein
VSSLPGADPILRSAAGASATLRAAGRVIRFLLRPFGYLAFAIALAALISCARLLGERNELGYFTARLSDTLRRYPEVSRRGVQTAWVGWALLFLVAISPLDPLATDWDEIALGIVGLLVAVYSLYARRDGR